MYVRALIVVLIVLNAGVALWWALQPPPAPPPAPLQPTGVARLELLPTVTGAGGPGLPAAARTGSGSAAESASTAPAPSPSTASGPASVPTPTTPAVAGPAAPTSAAPPPATTAAAQAPRGTAEASAAANAAMKPTNAVAATAAQPSPAPSPPAAERCASLGPFAARADADAALARVRGQASRANVREDKDAGISTFRVMLPNVGDRAAAQALVKRIAAAGMGDYYVIAQGEDNTVALGQYQSRERAERRQASLVGAGFPAQLVPSGNGQSRWWIDVRTSAATNALQGAAGAARQRSLDCAALR
ncbi:SPOR domain-containing protein [Xanthomonas campestris pv. zingibericola]|uniref:SPOR domain-containing protein n=1 Tax=Xanthomonas TaxID=338 RepID=UPI0009B879CB|nr:SPOR domain-containing protein [Xanthomonas euvesicatoria]MBV6858622.1 SPOR domain-containing protein [Xanthomonas campestris pv. zingibericola]MCC8913741.1 SPOR domain-containing protein [Xanthomonas euvesicatoria]MCP3040576.1 SPOR domain-containing protein [Xanthomonas euvesicatoria pv. allii]MCP3052560.1 SPOR domain-containing protein [Xanthomonas euvesicatoria pv. allii]QTK47365.1 SPOR domain-containing protein [Xanthomonas euvesicatoria pv. alfalfae]